MKNPSTGVYATPNDMLAIFQAEPVELGFDVAFVQNIKAPDVVCAASLTYIDQFWQPPHGRVGRIMILVPTGSAPQSRAVAQVSGGANHFLTPDQVPAAVVLHEGGMFTSNDRSALIAGTLSVVKTDPWSRDLYRVLSRKIKKMFTKRGAFYLGPEACALSDQGLRLTPDVNLPAHMDLPKAV